MADFKSQERNLLIVVLLFAFILVFPAISPFLKSGFFEIHDQTHFERLYELDKCLKAGQFPCRIAPDFAYGYGYPLFNFYAPLSYYLGEVFHFLGFGFIDSIKAVFVLAVFLGFIGMFLLSREFFGFYGGLASGLIYVYTPYRAVNLYVRGALSESLALGLVPLVTFFLIKSFKEKRYLWVCLGGIFYACLILSHNITALIFTAFLFSLIIIYTPYFFIKKSKSLNYSITNYLITLIFGLLLSSFFWLPALVEQPLVSTESMTKGILDYRLHFPKITQLIYSRWTYGGSGANVGISAEDMSFQLGILNWLVIPMTIFLIVKFWKLKRSLSLFLLFSIFYFLFSIFLITSKSKFLWELVPFIKYIQFPWRFLGWTTFFSSFLISGLFLLPHKELLKIILFFVLSSLSLVLNLNYFKPKSQFLIDEKSYLNTTRILSGTTGVTDEYYPKWVKLKPSKKAENLIEIKKGKPIISNLKTNFFKTEFDYSAKTNSEIVINYIYYPGFKAYFNEKDLEIRYNNNRGLINLALPKGQGKIKVIFQETNLRKIANIVSLMTFFLIISFLFCKYTAQLAVRNIAKQDSKGR